MDLIKVIIKQLTLDMVVKITDTRFCKQELVHLPSDYEAVTVHCTKLGTLTKIRQPYRTSLVDEDAPLMILNELQIRNYMKYLGGTVYDNEGYIVWLSDDDDLIIERVLPDNGHTAFYPLTIKGKKYIDYAKYLSFVLIGG